MPPKKTEKGLDDDLASCLINSEKFKNFIKFIVQEENVNLLEEVKTLRQEIVILRESNIQLINMLTSNNSNFNIQSHHKPINQIDKNKTAVAQLNSKIMETLENKNTSNLKETKTLIDKKLISDKNNHSTSRPEKDEQNKYMFNKRNNTKVLTGTILNDRSGGKLSGVDKKVYLHISKFKNEEADTNDLLNYIKDDVNIEGIECDKLKTYYGNHTYFKLGIPHEFLDKFYRADYWPYGVEIRKFLFRSNKNRVPAEGSSNTREN